MQRFMSAVAEAVLAAGAVTAFGQAAAPAKLKYSYGAVVAPSEVSSVPDPDPRPEVVRELLSLGWIPMRRRSTPHRPSERSPR